MTDLTGTCESWQLTSTLRQQRGLLNHERSYFSPYWIKKEQAGVRIFSRGNPPRRWLHLFRRTEHKERKFHHHQSRTYILQKLRATPAVALKRASRQRPHILLSSSALPLALVSPLSLLLSSYTFSVYTDLMGLLQHKQEASWARTGNQTEMTITADNCFPYVCWSGFMEVRPGNF